MNILDLKKLMLVPLACCVLVQQTDAKVVYSEKATQTLQDGIEPEVLNGQNDGTLDEKYKDIFTSVVKSYVPERREKNPSEGEQLKFPDFYGLYPEYAMVGVGTYIPRPKQNGRGPKDARVLFAGCDQEGVGDSEPTNTPEGNDVSNLFKFNKRTHTERQLASCALWWDAGGSTETGEDGIKLAGNLPKDLGTDRSKIQGELHIYTRDIPCVAVKKGMKKSGGMFCTEYYGYLSNHYPNLKIHAYFERSGFASMSNKALSKCRLSELLKLTCCDSFTSKEIDELNAKMKGNLKGLRAVTHEKGDERVALDGLVYDTGDGSEKKKTRSVSVKDLDDNLDDKEKRIIGDSEQLRSTLVDWVLNVMKARVESGNAQDSEKIANELLHYVMKVQETKLLDEKNVRFHIITR